MQTRTKLMALELIGGLFGWVWIFASIASVYLFVAAIAFGGRWQSLLWALGCSAVAKWLAKGFNASQARVGYEAELVAHGLSGEEAAEAWVEAASGGADALAEQQRRTRGTSDPLEAAELLVNQYGAALEHCGDLIGSEEMLPAPNDAIKAALVAVTRASNATGQLPPDTLNQLRIGYASLSHFVAPADAEVAGHFTDLATTDANDARLREIAEGLVDSRAVEIQQKCSNDFAQLAKEFDAAIES